MKILIAGHDIKQNRAMKALLSAEGRGNRIETVEDGKLCMEQLKKDCPDLLILDYVIAKLDAITILNQIKELALAVPCILLVPKNAEYIVTRQIRARQTWIMKKPVSDSMLLSSVHAMEFAQNANHESAFLHPVIPSGFWEHDLEIQITNILHDIGIPAHIKGYQFLRYAIHLACQDMDILNAVTKQLYPDIASHFDTTPQRVERAIRHAIYVAWERGKTEKIQTYFSYNFRLGAGKPTNSEFIAMIADKLRLENKMKSA